jgi:hypothetical protein
VEIEMSKHSAIMPDTTAASPVAETAGMGNLAVRKLATSSRRSPALTVELVAMVGLALSTLIAITVVSIGIARADLLCGVRASSDAPITLTHHD